MKKQVLIGLLVIMSGASAWGQGCAVCTKAAAGLDGKTAKGMNSGILYLAAVPLTILGTLGFIWWRHNKPE